MNFITREVTTYTHTFGRVDLRSGNITDMQSIVTTRKLSKKSIDAMAKENNYGIYVGTSTATVTYCLPLDLFVTLADEWMKEHDERPYQLRKKDQTTIDMPE